MRKLTSSLGPILLLSVLAILIESCARAPLKGPENAMRRVAAPELLDDLPLQPLLDSIESEIAFLEKSGTVTPLIFGERTFTREEYLQGLRHFLDLGRKSSDQPSFLSAVARDFDFFEVYGQGNWGEAFITSYYEPVIQGSTKPTEKFSQPVYGVPTDLVALDLAEFDPKFTQERKLRGRITNGRLVPYYSREQIDANGALKGKKLEICWLDPIDAFFLQIQGSGTVDFGNGKKLRLNYAEKNGQPYEQLSKYLKPYIPADQMNLHTIEAYLRKLSKPELQKVLNLNPSYVFFKPLGDSATTYLGVSATDGRTIATDRRYFPKGALGFLAFEKPVFTGPTELVPGSSTKTGRFVLDQDIGGAIQGGGRLDLFWGRGDEAKRYAGAMKNWGQLYYIAPKSVAR